MHKCHICDTNQARGIYVFNVYICEGCHEKMIATDPQDPNYRFFIDKLKRIHQSPTHS